jgi:hypothetical protein
VTDKPKTRAQLELELAKLREEYETLREAHQVCRVARQREADVAAQKHSEMDDLKTRLANSEAETQRMRGYIARVQEDDVVREDLVKVGDPDGEHQLVPKRKATAFRQPDPYDAGVMMAATDYGHRPRSNPRHWVTY